MLLKETRVGTYMKTGVIFVFLFLLLLLPTNAFAFDSFNVIGKTAISSGNYHFFFDKTLAIGESGTNQCLLYVSFDPNVYPTVAYGGSGQYFFTGSQDYCNFFNFDSSPPAFTGQAIIKVFDSLPHNQLGDELYESSVFIPSDLPDNPNFFNVHITGVNYTYNPSGPSVLTVNFTPDSNYYQCYLKVNGSLSADGFSHTTNSCTFHTSFNFDNSNLSLVINGDSQAIHTGSSDNYYYAPSPPVINQLSNTTINEGDTYTTTETFTDPDSTSWTGTINYGDGSGIQPLTLSGMNFSLSHVYTAPGTYIETVFIIDNQGATGTQTATITVNTPPTITSANSYSTSMRNPFSFTVTTTGDPIPSLSETGVLPAGITFVDNGDGTALLAGNASIGTAGTYPLTITADNGTGILATQNFVLTVTTAMTAPAIISDSADTETFGIPFSFTVDTTGYPVPTLTKTGPLPAGVTFTNNGDGTATMTGTPNASAVGNYPLTIKAKSSAGTTTQSFTLTITKTPVLKKIITKTAHVGTAFTMTINSTGDPTPTLTESGTIPNGLTFTDNGDGTASITGSPSVGSGGSYSLIITATNQLGASSQTFILKVNEAPTITSTASATGTQETSFSFQVTTTGFPTPLLSKSGTLPKGITFQASTGTLSGTPKAGTAGNYPLIITAKNSSGSVTQNFILTIQ